jgi:hypothetical protein
MNAMLCAAQDGIILGSTVDVCSYRVWLSELRKGPGSRQARRLGGSLLSGVDGRVMHGNRGVEGQA